MKRMFRVLVCLFVFALSGGGCGVGVLWKPPFRMDVTRLLRPGENLLEVR